MNTLGRRAVLVGAGALLVAAGCAGSDSADAVDGPPSTAESTSTAPGVRRVSATDGAAIQADPPADLVILDVRTLDEFNGGHIEGAEMLDFYRDDFAAQVAELDPDVPYLLYCQAGGRSGETAALMESLGFADVADVDGGIAAWQNAGLKTVSRRPQGASSRARPRAWASATVRRATC